MYRHPVSYDISRKAPKSLSVYQRDVRTGFKILLIIIADAIFSVLFFCIKT